MTTASEPIHEVDVLKLGWKTASTLRFAVAVVETGLRLLQASDPVRTFNNDEVPEHAQPLDRTTVGSVFHILKRMGIIEPTDTVRPSTRPGCNRHRNLLWRVSHVGKAETFLRRNRSQMAPRQRELFETVAA